MDNIKNETYYAFISYKHCDNAPWAKPDHQWALKVFEYLTQWNIPVAISPEKLINEDDKQINPVFLDSKEMRGGDRVLTILRDELLLSKTQIVICSKKMLAEQYEKQKRSKQKRYANDKAYIFEEITTYQENVKDGRVILVWIDKEPFKPNSPECLPPQFINSDVKVIEANNYRKGLFVNTKLRTTAEIAASIFQTNKGAFWDNYARQRNLQYTKIVSGIIIICLVLFFLIQSNIRNKAYINISTANELLDAGDRHNAMRFAAKAYGQYPNANGIGMLMHKCLDNDISYAKYDGVVRFSDDGSLYFTISNNNQIDIFDSNSNLVETILVPYVEDIVISEDNNIIGCMSTVDSIRLYDRSKKEFFYAIKNDEADPFNQDRKFIFNKRGDRLFVYRNDNDMNGKLYNVNSTPIEYFSPTMLYSQIDTVEWSNQKINFIDDDHLVIYGKERKYTDHESSFRKIHPETWMCKIYDLREADPRKKDVPKLIESVNLPNNTTNIAFSRKHSTLVVTTTDSVSMIRFTNNHYYTRREKLKNTIYGENKSIEKYKSLNKDWGNRNIVDIKLSENEQYALIIDDNNVREVKNILRYENITLNNVLSMSEGALQSRVYNDNSVAIGVTNSGGVIVCDQSNHNKIKLGDRTVLIKPEIVNGDANLQVSMNNSGVIVLKETNYYRENVYTSTEGLTTTLLYNLNSDDYFQRLRFQKDTTVESISQTIDYAILDCKPNSSILYDLKNKRNICKLDSIYTYSKSIYGSQSIFFNPNRLMVSFLHDAKDKPQTWYPSILNYDFKLDSIIRVFYRCSFETITDREIIVRDEQKNNSYIYDVLNNEIVYEFPKDGYISISENNIICTYRTNPDDWKSRRTIVYNFKIGEVADIPLSNGRSLIVNNSQGVYLAEYIKPTSMILGQPISDTIVLYNVKDKNHSIKYSVTKKTLQNKWGDFLYFTNDNKYAIYQDGYNGMFLLGLETHNIKWHILGNFDIRGAGEQYLYNKIRYSGFACSDKYIALLSRDIEIFDLETGEKVREIDAPDLIRSENTLWRFTPDGNYLIAANYLIDIKNMKCIDTSLPFHTRYSQSLYTKYINNNSIIYNDQVYYILSDKERYNEIQKELSLMRF